MRFLLFLCILVLGGCFQTPQKRSFVERVEAVNVVPVASNPDTYAGLVEGLNENEKDYAQQLVSKKAHEYCSASGRETMVLRGDLSPASEKEYWFKAQFVCEDTATKLAPCNCECDK